MYRIGQVVYSKAGRDKGCPFIIVAVAENYLYLADGDIRKLVKPKRKKLMHVQPTRYRLPDGETDALINGRLLDANIRRFLHCLKTI